MKKYSIIQFILEEWEEWDVFVSSGYERVTKVVGSSLHVAACQWPNMFSFVQYHIRIKAVPLNH